MVVAAGDVAATFDGDRREGRRLAQDETSGPSFDLELGQVGPVE